MGWRNQICESARSWLGTPYVARARVKGVGVDCGGILYEVYGPVFGPFKPYPTDYPVDWAAHSDAERYLDFIMPYVKEVPVVQIGGFSLFHIGLAYSHAAIYLGNDDYIHAWGRTGEGAVTITKGRVMRHLAKGFPVKNFDPKDEPWAS